MVIEYVSITMKNKGGIILKFKKINLFLLLIFLTFFMVACNQKEEKDIEVSKSYDIKHALGKTTIKNPVKKVVVFDYGVLDTLDELDVDVQGVVKSNMPNFLKKFKGKSYEDIGTLFEPNFEKIFELNPDLIIISGRQASQYEELSKIAPTLYIEYDSSKYMESFEKNTNMLAKIFKKEEKSEKILNELKKDMNKLKEKISKLDKKAEMIMVSEKSLSAYGLKSRYGFIFEDFGFKVADNEIEASNHGQNISFEYLVEKNSDILLVLDRNAIIGSSDSAKAVLDNSMVKMTNAYKNEKIIYLDPQAWYITTGGVKSLKIMISDLEKAL